MISENIFIQYIYIYIYIYVNKNIFVYCCCVLVSRVPGIPYFYDWVPFQYGLVGLKPLASILFTILDSRCLLQVYITTNIWSYIGHKIIHATTIWHNYNMNNNYIHANKWIRTDNIEHPISWKFLHSLVFNTRDDSWKGVAWEMTIIQ